MHIIKQGLPQGSGLGTSSILIACVLKVVWYMMGIEVSNESLSYSILLVEQLMTTSNNFDCFNKWIFFEYFFLFQRWWMAGNKIEHLITLSIHLNFSSCKDQVGGIWPGFKLTTAKNQLPIEINIKQLHLSKEFSDIINSRIILIYTGITRLAKDLLLNVIRNWYAISKDIYDNVQDLVKNAHECSQAISNGNQLKAYESCISVF